MVRLRWAGALPLMSALVLGTAHPASSAEPRTKLVIAVQPTSTPEKLADGAVELERYLEEALGQDVEITFPTSYAGVVEALRFGHADAAFMSAWPALLAQQKAAAQVVLAEVREVIIDGQKAEQPYYYSYWVVPTASPYTDLGQLKGKKAAFSSPLSTSGYVAPLARLVELGYVARPDSGPADPKTYFSEALMAGGYAQAYEALKSGQADVGLIAGDVPQTLYEEVLGHTRVIDKQGPIPSHAVVVAKELDADRRERLVSALEALGTPERRDLMRKFVSGIFVRFERRGAEHLEGLGAMLLTTGLEYQDKK
ncbi:MAG: putative phosphite transport system-binding protein PtxB [Candidatus Omnitrophica bacterium]|nr:putative phosphite transport system-binding protein PtxB [Candidatus Omnitrophota bacterium]